ncbi:hypothetical protein [Shinella sumterensis]|uniref:hypothetical protein n=1 Tax=Shinella sumterensis TaxID=1967501 RepID=UPI003F84E295
MADSENSTVFFLKTRRNVLLTAMMSAITMTMSPSPSAVDDTSLGDDAVLRLWRQWHSVHLRRCELTLRSQQLEAELLEIVEEPVVAIETPGMTSGNFAFSIEQIERSFTEMEMAQVKAEAIGRLNALQQAWEIAGWELGYTQTCEEEVKADRLEWKLAESLLACSANSIHGVMAKLHCMIEMQGPGPFIAENPGPALRLMLADLMRINGTPDFPRTST